MRTGPRPITSKSCGAARSVARGRCNGTGPGRVRNSEPRWSRARSGATAAPGRTRCRSSPFMPSGAGSRATRRRVLADRVVHDVAPEPARQLTHASRKVVAAEYQRVVASRARARSPPWASLADHAITNAPRWRATATRSDRRAGRRVHHDRSPLRTRWVRRSRNWAVRPLSIAAAASRSLTPSGIFTRRSRPSPVAGIGSRLARRRRRDRHRYARTSAPPPLDARTFPTEAHRQKRPDTARCARTRR